MKLLLVTKAETLVPDIELTLEDGSTINNRDLPVSTRIECEIEYASKAETEQYYKQVQIYNKKTKDFTTETLSDYGKCVSSNCSSISGCITENGIIDGKTLVEYQTQPMLNKLIDSIYNAVMGFEKIKPVKEKLPEENVENVETVSTPENGGALGDSVASV